MKVDNDVVKFDCLVNNYGLADLRRCEQKDVPERRDGDYFEIQVLLPFFFVFLHKSLGEEGIWPQYSLIKLWETSVIVEEVLWPSQCFSQFC